MRLRDAEEESAVRVTRSQSVCISQRRGTYNIEPNFPAPMRPICIGLPAASRSASLVDRLVILATVMK